MRVYPGCEGLKRALIRAEFLIKTNICFNVVSKVRRWKDVNKTSDGETFPHFCFEAATESCHPNIFLNFYASFSSKRKPSSDWWFKITIFCRFLNTDQSKVIFLCFSISISLPINQSINRLLPFFAASPRRGRGDPLSPTPHPGWIVVVFVLMYLCICINVFLSMYLYFCEPVACIARPPPLAPQTAVDSRIEPSEEGTVN